MQSNLLRLALVRACLLAASAYVGTYLSLVGGCGKCCPPGPYCAAAEARRSAGTYRANFLFAGLLGRQPHPTESVWGRAPSRHLE